MDGLPEPWHTLKYEMCFDFCVCGTVWAFLVSIGYVTLIKEGTFEAETWLITQNLKPEKGCVIENLSTPSSKENGNIVISKDGHGKTVLGP